MQTMTEQQDPPTNVPARTPRWIWYVMAGVVTLAVVATVAAVLAVSNRPEKAAAISSPTPSSTADALTREEEFYLSTTRLLFPDEPGMDESLLALVRAMCEKLDGGVPIAELVKVSTDMPRATVLDVMNNAIANLCPAHGAAFSQYRSAPQPVQIEDGTWTVGTDFPAGRYRTTAPAGGDCYWAILRSGTNGGDIINNNLGGGRPVVTLKSGQDFETRNCGTWEPVR